MTTNIEITKEEWDTRPKAAVCGSFRRAMALVECAIDQLRCCGVRVLSPADVRVVGNVDGFVFISSDRSRDVRMVEDSHLFAIDNADFVWLIAPGGYVGLSAAMEVGYAHARGVPVFCDTSPSDITLRQYVVRVADLPDAVVLGGHRSVTR